MGCCGEKRAQLSQDRVTRAAQTEPDHSAPPVREEKTRTFQYVGRGTLTVHGAVTGQAYRFAGRGDRVEVNYVDAFGMMAERDVKPELEKWTSREVDK